MSGSFRAGEEKERPGVYRRHDNAGGTEVAGAAEGVGLAVVSGTWGPLNKPMVTDASDDVASIIGSGKGANVITQMRIGGVNDIVVVRVGSGGTPATITLKDDKEAAGTQSAGSQNEFLVLQLEHLSAGDAAHAHPLGQHQSKDDGDHAGLQHQKQQRDDDQTRDAVGHFEEALHQQIHFSAKVA